MGLVLLIEFQDIISKYSYKKNSRHLQCVAGRAVDFHRLQKMSF